METPKHAMAQGDLYRQNENCQKAQNIITELMSCLDMERGGEIAQSLYALYSFALDRLVDANLTDSPAGIDQAIKVLTELRGGWNEIEKAGADKASAA